MSIDNFKHMLYIGKTVSLLFEIFILNALTIEYNNSANNYTCKMRLSCETG